MRIRAETVTAIAATFTAMAALAIAVWDNVQTREHNRLSIAPRLTIDMSRENSVTRLTVRNDGIGPALVDRMIIRFEDSGRTTETETWEEVGAAVAAAGHSFQSSWLFTPGDAIGIDRSFTLLAVVEDSGGGDGRVTTSQLIGRIGILIEYGSIYGETWTARYNWPE